MNRAQQIKAVKEAAWQEFLGYGSDDFDLAVRRLVDSARLDGAYHPEHTLIQHKANRKARRSR